MAGGRGRCEREAPRGVLWVWPLIVHQMITDGKAGGDGVVGGGVPNGVLGAGMGCVAGRPLARPGVHRVLGQVFSFRPNVSTLRPDVSTFPTDFPQMCPLGPLMCPPGRLTGDSRRPGLLGRRGPEWE